MDIRALSELIEAHQPAQEHGSSAPPPNAAKAEHVSPASIGQPKGVNEASADTSAPAAPTGQRKAPADEQAIWAEEEADDGRIEQDDEREEPEYDIVYKQTLASQDAGLGMPYVHKDPSSTSCEALSAKVKLPGTIDASELDVDVQPWMLRLQSPQYKLVAPLVHEVQPGGARARWDGTAELLTIDMPMKHEEGYVPSPLDSTASSVPLH